MADIIKAMVSSTAKDLKEYREQVQDACLRMDVMPKMMEHLSAEDADAVEVSLRMVEESDIYIGIYAHRYGYIPDGESISITHMEYNHAVKLGKPRFLFFVSDQVPVLPQHIDMESYAKLQAFKEELGKKRVAAFFDSPADLRSKALQSLETAKKQLKKKSPIAPKNPQG
jgi:hypothetical protein